MAQKILLVEDDNNLREIYEARLMAEGYTIVTAPDGESALAIASKEKPDLVISDVMMPNISGFDMLDIMRNTEGLKKVHVIMLTALSQAEDQARAQSLGADRYLVKSQVTLEDIVNNAKAILNDSPMPAGNDATPQDVPAPVEQPVEQPAEEPSEQPAEAPTEAPTETPAVPPQSNPANDALLADAVDQLNESVKAPEPSAPSQKVVINPISVDDTPAPVMPEFDAAPDPVEQPAEEPSEQPAEAPTNTPTEAPQPEEVPAMADAPVEPDYVTAPYKETSGAGITIEPPTFTPQPTPASGISAALEGESVDMPAAMPAGTTISPTISVTDADQSDQNFQNPSTI